MHNTIHTAGRYFLAVAILWGLGCSSDPPFNPTVPSETMVSEVGELVYFHQYDGGEVPVFHYADISFHGDILLAEFASARTDMASRITENETLFRVYNFRAFPEGFLFSEPEDRFELRTLAYEQDDGLRYGYSYIYTIDEDRVVFSRSQWWHSRPNPDGGGKD